MQTSQQLPVASRINSTSFLMALRALHGLLTPLLLQPLTSLGPRCHLSILPASGPCIYISVGLPVSSPVWLFVSLKLNCRFSGEVLPEHSQPSCVNHLPANPVPLAHLPPSRTCWSELASMFLIDLLAFSLLTEVGDSPLWPML